MKTREKGLKTVIRLIKNDIKTHRLAMQPPISQSKLEKMVNATHPFINNCEAQRHQPSIERLARICIALNVQPEQLLRLDFTEIHELIEKYKSN